MCDIVISSSNFRSPTRRAADVSVNAVELTQIIRLYVYRSPTQADVDAVTAHRLPPPSRGPA
jgi:hypothetical protein